MAPCGAFALGGGLGGLAFGICMDLMLSHWAWNLGVVLSRPLSLTHLTTSEP